LGVGDRALALTEREVTDEQLAQELMLERYELDMRELAWSLKAAWFAETDYYDQAGSVSPIDWLRHNCHMTEGAAAARVAVGRRMFELPESLQALASGKIGFAHLTVMTRTADAVGDAFEEPKLLKEAEQSSPGKFFHTCRHYRHSADPVGYAAEQAEQVENRSLRLSRAEDGWYLLSGVLDSIGGAAVRNALEPLARKSGEHDDRNRERRLADALVELATERSQTQINVTSTLETLLGVTGSAAAEMDFSLPISSTTVERMACDCSVARILLGSESQVIDVGRSRRVVSGPARKALEVRDRHCQWPGCDRPAKWSAAHHVVHWIHGGATDLDNLVLLCHRHHWMVHEGSWQLVKTDGGRMLAIPPTVTFGQMARGPD
jgi:hypothetical protein